MKALFACILVLVGVVSALDNYSYQSSGLRKLGSAPKFAVDTANGIASCYGETYYYYKSWKCTNCANEKDVCPKTDPHDHTLDEKEQS